MLLLQRIPKLLRWIFSVVLLLLATMTIARILFYFSYNPPGKAFSGSAFILGLRFDARMACIAGLAILLLCAIPFVNPFKNSLAKKAWNFILPFVFTLLVLFYFIDFYHFDYLHQRLNATVLNYLEDAAISFSMMWQTYPLLKVSIAIIILWFVARFIFARLLTHYLQHDSFYKRRGIVFYIVSFFILAACIFGKIGQFPLRWSDAFTLSDDFKANLALNPFQSFFSTLSFRNATYDINKVKAGYPVMSSYLGVQQPDSNRLNYQRQYSTADSVTGKPNIVLVICESFSAYKSSMYGNPLNTTPYFNELCNNGIFFDRCFTPAYGTARGVWATITGIPDVEDPSTASRNPNAVDQHCIINNFTGYENYYFLGGSATWANIRGVLTNNINGLRLYEQEDYTAAKIDVWGISDKNLFLEANKVLKDQSKPFFAIIQTADNHRPYTIPKEDEGAFKKLSFSNDSLKMFGFDSNEEMNAFRYTDFGYQQFIEAAKKEKYFDNTIFVFVGDHGIRGNAGNMFPKSWTEQGLTCEHVPLLFYAPKLLQPKRVHDVCSQVDILPTIASLAKKPYRNNTFGRDLFDTVSSVQFKSQLSQKKYAFIIDHDTKTVGLIDNEYYFFKNLKTGNQNMVSMVNNDKVQPNATTDSIKTHLNHLTDAWYQTAKYLLLNNKKQ
jgi:phosphoglycerol transferase MdoB-like AlkP superfamily enzyme